MTNTPHTSLRVQPAAAGAGCTPGLMSWMRTASVHTSTKKPTSISSARDPKSTATPTLPSASAAADATAPVFTCTSTFADGGAFLTMTGAFAVARSLTGWRTAGYLASAVLAWDLVTLINGLIMQVNQPPVFTFFVLTPAAILLFIAAMRGSRSAAWATMAAVTVIALVHPTYAAPVIVPPPFAIVTASSRIPAPSNLTDASACSNGSAYATPWSIDIAPNPIHNLEAKSDETILTISI